MKIGIITVYESIDNLGSYLQTYALKSILERFGHEVHVIQNISTSTTLKKHIFRINPKREFFLRIKKAIRFIMDNKKLELISKNRIQNEDFDLLIYGSDEIWNLENPYFRNMLFWGDNVNINKISYAASVGDMSEETLKKHIQFTQNLNEFKKILVRDENTALTIERLLGTHPDIVCDPTMLLSLDKLSEPIRKPKCKYMLVYTYGIPEEMKRLVVDYARQNDLKIISVHFWHPWADKVMVTSPLQFSALIAGAECVFTTTFHGAVFTMLNHKNCCIFPMRAKVEDIVRKMGADKHLINKNCELDEFSRSMKEAFDAEEYEKRLLRWREFSVEKLKEQLYD